LNGTDGSATNAGDDLLLDASAASTDVGERFTYEDGTDDGSAVLSGGDLKFNNVEILMNETSLIKSGIGDTTTNIGQGLAKAFHGYGDQSAGDLIATSQTLNISSYVDQGTGNSRLNMTSAMSVSSGYVVMGSTRTYDYAHRAITASQYQVGVVDSSGNFGDGVTHGMIMGDLA